MKKLLALLFCLAIIITQTACENKEEMVSDSGFYLDTECTINLYNIEKSKGSALIKKAFDLCKNYENKMSKTIKGSDIYKINHAKGKAVEADKDTLEVIKLGLKVSDESKGVFDITVGALTDLWDFDSDNPKLPNPEKLKKAVTTVGYKNVVVKGRTVQLKNPRTKLDLGAVAKGYISGKMAQFLKSEGIENAIINLGGNVVAVGKKHDGSPWKVGIRKPEKDASKILGATSVKDKVVITSGVYERMFKLSGKKYHHILNPKTGYPISSDLTGVTLITSIDNAGECDAYSTVSLLMGKAGGSEFMKKHKDKYEAMFIDSAGKLAMSEGFVFEKVEE